MIYSLVSVCVRCVRICLCVCVCLGNNICPFPSWQPPFYSRDVGEMYDGILHKPLLLPPGKSEAVCSLLEGLLQKDQHRRFGAIADFVRTFKLGGGQTSRYLNTQKHLAIPNTVELIFFFFMCCVLQLEIKNHTFFSSINWDDIYHKRITPPYNPNVVSVSSLMYFKRELVLL